MDIALSTILLFFLLVPGLLFRRFYYTEEFSKEYFKESVSDFFLSTVIPSVFIHIITWQLVQSRYNLDDLTFSTLFSGTHSPEELLKAFKLIHQNLSKILWYFGLLAIVSIVLGIGSKILVRRTKLDRKVKLFRFQNEWHYLFSGEILDFPRVPGSPGDIDFTYVDALVETAEGTVIYNGLLADYILSKDGGIDRIYLTEAKRRYLKDDNKQNAYYELPGAFFVIPFSTVINLHLTYYNLELSPNLEAELRRSESNKIKS